MYKLTKPIIMGPERRQKLFLSTSGTWLTNGEWAIRRDLVEGGGLLLTQDALKLKFGPLAAEEAKRHRGTAAPTVTLPPTRASAGVSPSSTRSTPTISRAPSTDTPERSGRATTTTGPGRGTSPGRPMSPRLDEYEPEGGGL